MLMRGLREDETHFPLNARVECRAFVSERILVGLRWHAEGFELGDIWFHSRKTWQRPLDWGLHVTPVIVCGEFRCRSTYNPVASLRVLDDRRSSNNDTCTMLALGWGHWTVWNMKDNIASHDPCSQFAGRLAAFSIFSDEIFILVQMEYVERCRGKIFDGVHNGFPCSIVRVKMEHRSQ